MLVTLVTYLFLEKNQNAAIMAIPLRRSNPCNIAAELRTFFVTSSIIDKRRLLQSNRAARLFIDVLNHSRVERKYFLHSFVVMPDHFHAVITVGQGMTIERAVQFIKGGFAFWAGRELGFKAPVWQRGFSEVRIYEEDQLRRIVEYIAQNPIRQRLAVMPHEYPYCSSAGGFALDPFPRG